MAAVVCQIHPSIHAAYRDQEDEIGVIIKSVYDKLGGIEPVCLGPWCRKRPGESERSSRRWAAGSANCCRITVHLYEPTRDGETEIHILTNLPQKVTPVMIAGVYGNRWTIETAFQEMGGKPR